MKNIIIQLISLLFLFLSACSSPEADSTVIPEDLQEKKAMLREVRSEAKDLNERIKMLEDAIAEQDPDFAPKLTLVATEVVAKSSFNNYANLQATVQADETAMAGPELPGRIISLRVDEGDNVRRGQLIATLNVESVSVQKAELETAASLAKTVFERQQRLWEQNIGSEIQYLEAKNNYERIQQSLKSLDVQLAKANVYAPISGTVQQVFMRAGENAMPGAPIVSIISTGKLKIVADAPEEFLTKVKRGVQVKVNVPTLDESFTAPITRIGKTVDAANRTFEVEINVPSGKTNQLKTNLLAEVEVLESEITDAIVISQDVIQQEVNGQRYTFVAAPGEDGLTIAKKVYVETGDRYENQVVITSGLSVGDRIITTGSRGLVSGQPIDINATTTSPADNGK
ncbi:hypothetical protein CEQ90_18910 [Lewinellaceae bacterium SD302]|nr:hypothetical protein CEQ90_18910 [Lewinellaceae bacterium SD302]